MIRLPKSVLVSALALLLLLFLVNLWMQRNLSLQRSDTSFGVTGDGYKAAFDLLRELEVPVARSYFRANRVPPGRTVWFVLPDFLEEREEEAKTDLTDLMRWIRAGGTAVVLGRGGSDWSRLGLDETASSGGETSVVQGAFARTARSIPVAGLAHFDKAGASSQVRLTAGKATFAIETSVGSGRLIAIADGRFMLNSNLDQGDDSLLLVDLVHALGTPTFDEHCHGLAAPASSLALFGHPRLLAVLVLALITTLLWIAEQRSWPTRTLKDVDDAPAPSIASFVDSLGVLYARANDPPAAFRAYRASFLRRARRRLSPRVEVSDQVVIERITRDRSLSADSRFWLAGDNTPSSEAELIRAVRALEACPILSHEQRHH